MAVVDVASLGVTVEAQGVDATRAALEGIEALGQRVGRTVGQITLRLSGTDVIARQAQAAGESVSRIGAAATDARRAVLALDGTPVTRIPTDTAVAALRAIGIAAREVGTDVRTGFAQIVVPAERLEAAQSLLTRLNAAAVAMTASMAEEAVVARTAAEAEATLARAREAAARPVGAATLAPMLATPTLTTPAAPIAGGALGTDATRQATDALTAAIARADAAVTAAGDAAVEAARESAALTAVLDREADAARRAAAEEAALAQARQRAGTVASPSPSAPRPPAGPRELGPASSSVERNDAAVARNVAAERSAAALGETVARVTRVVQEQGAALDATNARAVAAFRNSTDAAAAYLVKLGATDAQIDALGASIAEVEARAAGATTKVAAKGAATERAGTIAGASATKFRSAANGITAVAFAATAGGGSMQSMALAAGLAASSMAQLSGAAGAVAGGIGAAITVGVALVGVLDQIRQKRQAALLRDAVDPRFTRSSEEAQASLGHLDRQADLLRKRIVELRETTFQFGAGGFGVEGAFLGPVRAAQRELANVEERARELRRQRAEPLAAQEAEQRRQAVVGGLQAENQAVAAAVDARLATERGAYEQGRSDLASYFASRVAAVRSGAAREVDELRAQQRALRDDTGRPADETKAARDSRLAEASQIDAQVRAVRSRAAGEEAAARAERESAERALAARLVGYEAEVATARGDAHGAALLQIGQRVEAFQQAMAQEGRLTAEQQKAAARFYGDTLTRQAEAAEAQRVLAREQSALGAKRAEIQAQVAKGTLTEVQGQQAIAAAERERLPALNAQLAILERIALALNNPDLLAFVRQMRGELAGWGEALSPLQERMKAVFNDLAARATAMTDAVRAKIDELVSKAGGVVTPKIAIQAEWMSGMAASINEQWSMMGVNAGAVFVDSIRAGIEGFGSGPITFGSFFKNMGNTLLAGLGGVMAEMGAQLLVMGGVMTGLLPFFSNPITAGPAMLIAGGILLTAGAALGAIATRNRGGGGGGGGGSISAPASFDQSASVILTPRAAGKAPAPMNVVHQTFNVMGDTPEVQRFISKVTVSASRRGMPVGATR